MNGRPPEINRYCPIAAKLAIITVLMSLSAASIAGSYIAGPKWQPDEEEEAVYVDSVTKWGPWELDIEPAAGGVELTSPRAMNPRDSKVALRTNSIAELGPPSPPPYSGPAAPTTFAPPAATPINTFTPPPTPNVIPVSPTTPIPSGNGSLF